MRRARAEVKLTKYDAAANDTEDDHKDRKQTSSCICLFLRTQCLGHVMVVVVTLSLIYFLAAMNICRPMILL